MPVRIPKSAAPAATLSSEPPAFLSNVAQLESLSYPCGERRSMTSPIVIRSNLDIASHLAKNKT